MSAWPRLRVSPTKRTTFCQCFAHAGVKVPIDISDDRSFPGESAWPRLFLSWQLYRLSGGIRGTKINAVPADPPYPLLRAGSPARSEQLLARSAVASTQGRTRSPKGNGKRS